MGKMAERSGTTIPLCGPTSSSLDWPALAWLGLVWLAMAGRFVSVWMHMCECGWARGLAALGRGDEEGWGGRDGREEGRGREDEGKRVGNQSIDMRIRYSAFAVRSNLSKCGLSDRERETRKRRKREQQQQQQKQRRV